MVNNPYKSYRVQAVIHALTDLEVKCRVRARSDFEARKVAKKFLNDKYHGSIHIYKVTEITQ